MSSYVYVKNPNGTVYVYENESYWDPKEKKTKHHRKCVGKLDPGTKEIIPTRKAKHPQRKKGLQVTTVGPLLLLDRTAVKTGLSDSLARAFPDDWSEVLTASYYVLTERGPLSLMEPWSRSVGRPLRKRDLEDFLQKISIPVLEQALVYGLKQDKDSSCIVFAVSAIPSLTHYLASSGKGLEQTRLTIMVIADSKALVPFTYKVLPEYPANLCGVLDQLSNFPRRRLVLGPGFYSKRNLDVLFSTSTGFIMQLPLSSPLSRKALKGEALEWNGKPCYAYLDRDETKARLESRQFERMLREGMEELRTGRLDGEKAMFYERFYIARDGKAQYNEEEIGRFSKEELGRIVLISDKPMVPDEVSMLFKKAYLLERNFHDIISDYDQKMNGGLDISMLPGRIFLDFVALVLATYIQNQLDKEGWMLDEVMAELKGIKQVTPENGKPLLSELTERQREIIAYFDLLPESSLK